MHFSAVHGEDYEALILVITQFPGIMVNPSVIVVKIDHISIFLSLEMQEG